MEIRFISSLTAEDEARLAPALAELIGALLDTLPFAYTVRIETIGGIACQRTHPSMQGEMAAKSGFEPPPPQPGPL